jgi:hypothetical protein
MASREAVRRGWLHRVLAETLERVNALTDPAQPLRPSLGDEFQGVFHTVREAVQASLLIRLELQKAADADARFGLGYGSTSPVSDQFPAPQDGPGWWSARDAILESEALSRDQRTAFVRTFFSCDSAPVDLSPTEISTVNAFLICRDALVHQMNPRRRRLLLGLLQDRTQRELAEEEGVSPPAVSQNLSRSGAYAIDLASMIMEKSPP